jgi:hypothetical protein
MTIQRNRGWKLSVLTHNLEQASLDRFLRAILTMPELRKTLAHKQALELSSVN